jgi:O-acetyl-ADP-ribose deacetylase (regulator of RNase III)
MKISIHKGVITKLDVDVIVNAANSSLLGGGGVDGAIHRAAGKDLEFACRMLGGCKTGEAKLTLGFDLPAKHIIHTVGPVWNNSLDNPGAKLKNCYKNTMQIAVKENFKSIAFPCISTGIYKFPNQLAAEIAVSTILEFKNVANAPTDIIFCCFLSDDVAIYEDVFAKSGVLT